MFVVYIYIGFHLFSPISRKWAADPDDDDTKAQFRLSMRGARDSRTRFARIEKFNRIHCVCLFNAHMYRIRYTRLYISIFYENAGGLATVLMY